MDEGGGNSSPDSIGGGSPLESDIGVTVIVNGLLGSILKALSRNADRGELASLIEKYSAKDEIKCAWSQLFGFFKDVVDTNLKKPVIQITRSSYSIMVDDILKQLSEYEKSSNILQIAIPWNYVIKEFQTDSESRGQLWETSKRSEYDVQLKNLESRMDKKHNDMIADLKKWSDDIVNIVKNMSNNSAPTYANALVGGFQKGMPHVSVSQAGNNMCSFNQPLQQPSPSIAGNVHSYPSFEPPGRFLAPPGVSQTGVRSRSNSNKRRQGEDGSVLAVGDDQQQQNDKPKNNLSLKKKSVTGTSNSLLTGRKMKSPPADIFVWGVHKDTSVDDIVKDLAESEIVIEAKDVQQKSKEDANLKSFKTSVPAADLNKARDPSIWLLRVKVREYIYYSSKKKDKESSQPAKEPSGDAAIV